MAKIEFNNVVKKYSEDVKAVDDFNIKIEDGEFVVFVGPSGCGKSTTLRMVAGLEDITEGEIKIDGKVINDVKPKDRDIAMVFQNYALYPHMNVYKNMAFALENQKIDKDIIDKRVREAAEMLNLTKYLKRKPKALSGGQRQRVALGRAIVRHAKVFLMDEPLSNLDAKLRVSTRSMIVDLHNKLKTNTIYVTHDQTEAMTMGDRLVVMKDGIIQQFDTPENIYSNPSNVFVAGFIGVPQMNFIRCNIKRDSDSYYAYRYDKDTNSTFKTNFLYKLSGRGKLDRYIEEEIILGIRPEHLALASESDKDFSIKVENIEFLGSDKYIYSTLFDETISIRVEVESDFKIGDIINVRIKDDSYVNLFESSLGKNIGY